VLRGSAVRPDPEGRVGSPHWIVDE